MRSLLAVLIILGLAASCYGLNKKAVQMREDFGTEPLAACNLNYYYYIPCTSTGSSWFWYFSGWVAHEVIGEWFRIGDPSMGLAGSGCPPYTTCDPCNNVTITQFRVLDFAGYGTAYPGLFTVDFKIWCSDQRGCPVGAPLWDSGPVETCVLGWNYFQVRPNVCVTSCGTGNPKCYPRILLTAEHTGFLPEWGFDNISTPLSKQCVLHDYGCCPALYPRPTNSYYGTMHSGDYGVNFQYCPPYWPLNPADSDGTVFGYIELAWRIYMSTSGPTATVPTTWGSIKAIYK